MSYDQKGHETCNNPNKKVDVKDLQPNFIQIALISNIAVCAITFIAMFNINGFINDQNSSGFKTIVTSNFLGLVSAFTMGATGNYSHIQNNYTQTVAYLITSFEKNCFAYDNQIANFQKTLPVYQEELKQSHKSGMIIDKAAILVVVCFLFYLVHSISAWRTYCTTQK